MKELLKTLAGAAAGLMALSGLTGCVNDDTVDGPVAMPVTEMAVFAGNEEGRAVLLVRETSDAPEAKLRADRALTSDRLKAGDRTLITYTPANGAGNPYEPGDISLRQALIITNGTVTAAGRKEIEGLMSEGVYVYSMWRMGRYINLHCRLVYSTTPRHFGLMADEATLDSEWPDVYLVHKLEEPTENHDRSYYASYDLGDVWERPTCKGVNIHVNNTNLQQDTFTFEKTNKTE